ncbi:hypothetical protein WN51_09029 [Melipona quadrifasciata]|uniref:Uncharacterized protein n=1 Tax=Melipona quadrifasciata TaxID=166423 RepID=A0A0N0BBH6_9HYME|nr:hypothetical protein WN51_09029 [Melipona quadrifasciata]
MCIFQTDALHQPEQILLLMLFPKNILGAEKLIRAPTAFVLELWQYWAERYCKEEPLFDDLMQLIIVFTSNYHINAPIIPNNVRR